MITVIQRVSNASVTVNSQKIGVIGTGIMALVAVEQEDTEKQADRLLERILNYRIFPDGQGRMNLGLRAINGELLLVPQFTLAADTNSGNRPSFTGSASPEKSRKLFTYLQAAADSIYPGTQYGEFGADMQVALINNGPVTFMLRVSA
ncbi:D-tyrosyl-tRNA(Tyr) deacylase [Nitrosomonas sp. Nm51]|uniref:D-aminoacyl-tRNA deacylase n=1 Tax=Nitrosomonas sp. Nm51 TaxID=133720 RepID=UPI0008C14803|nr:D-aminoacyl-tRNA deacylase [Nitrosomonas sp. Nm51]SER10116.1 D-tyrosyl-tRNA(Tyr) deacylase [Nitrosomonas sp. Nm51]